VPPAFFVLYVKKKHGKAFKTITASFCYVFQKDAQNVFTVPRLYVNSTTVVSSRLLFLVDLLNFLIKISGLCVTRYTKIDDISEQNILVLSIKAPTLTLVSVEIISVQLQNVVYRKYVIPTDRE